MKFTRFWNRTSLEENVSKTGAATLFDDPKMVHLPDSVKNYVYLRDYAPVAYGAPLAVRHQPSDQDQTQEGKKSRKHGW